jgi:diguanylate cyclase (GGDEF)-like protein
MPAKPINILLVDDDPALLRLLRKWLEDRGFAVECAGNGRQAIAAIEANCPQILITDLDMPYVDGIGLCKWLRSQELASYVYTIVITGHISLDSMIESLDAGADDFIKKPVDKAELSARVRSGLRVLELESRLNVLAKTDMLTGLPTRRTFFELADREWSRAGRYHIPVSAVMVDIDFFKRINDTYGHRVGDDALRAIAKVLQESCRSSDIVGRYGGEEFCVLLPETNELHAIEWADRVRERIAGRTDLVPGLGKALTASFGVAQRLADTDSMDDLIELADQSLLVAKRSGRDLVVGFQSLANSTGASQEVDGPETVFEGLTAREVMTTIVAGIRENEPVGRAARYFLRFRFNSAPVVDSDGQLVGILSERDVMAIMMLPRWWETQVKDVMKKNVVCYEESASVVSIYEFLCRVSLRGVIVVKEGRPTGMISRGSLLRWFTNLLAITPSLALGEPSTELPGDDSMLIAEPRSYVSKIAQALGRQASELEARVQREGTDLVPIIVGGVSQIEELLNDLLAFSRHANIVDLEEPASQTRQPAIGSLSDALGMLQDETEKLTRY